MSVPLLIALLVGAIIVITAIGFVIQAPSLPIAVRLLAGFVFVPLAFFCVFGFAAAMEPGDGHVAWRVVYAVTFVACVLAIARALFAPRNRQTAGHDATD